MIRDQSLILVDPRREIEIQKFDVAMLGTVFRAEVLWSHPALVLTGWIETAAVLTEGFLTAVWVIRLVSGIGNCTKALDASLDNAAQ